MEGREGRMLEKGEENGGEKNEWPSLLYHNDVINIVFSSGFEKKMYGKSIKTYKKKGYLLQK